MNPTFTFEMNMAAEGLAHIARNSSVVHAALATIAGKAGLDPATLIDILIAFPEGGAARQFRELVKLGLADAEAAA